MSAYERAAAKHNRVSQSDDEWHESASDGQRWPRVNDLPHDGEPLKPSGEGPMWIQESANNDEVDARLMNQSTHSGDIGAEGPSNLQMKTGIKSCAHSMQGNLHDVDTTQSQSLRRTPVLLRQDDQRLPSVVA